METADAVLVSSTPPAPAGTAIPTVGGVVAVCAHPDDESFGLGAVLSAFTEADVRIDVVCFTHGEASTLHAIPGDLDVVREAELSAAAAHLGVGRTELLAYPDGGLTDQPLDELAGHVRRLADATGADTLLVFDLGGITGHPDHQRATEAALAAAAGGRFSILAWAVPDTVAQALNAEFDTSFVGRSPSSVDIALEVNRHRQLASIHCHASQSLDNPVLWRRLELQGNTEWLVWLQTTRTQGRQHAAPQRCR